MLPASWSSNLDSAIPLHTLSEPRTSSDGKLFAFSLDTILPPKLAEKQLQAWSLHRHGTISLSAYGTESTYLSVTVRGSAQQSIGVRCPILQD